MCVYDCTHQSETVGVLPCHSPPGKVSFSLHLEQGSQSASPSHSPVSALTARGLQAPALLHGPTESFRSVLGTCFYPQSHLLSPKVTLLLKCYLKISGYLSHHERTPAEGWTVRVWEAEAAEGPTGDDAEGHLSSHESCPSPKPGSHLLPPATAC